MNKKKGNVNVKMLAMLAGLLTLGTVWALGQTVPIRGGALYDKDLECRGFGLNNLGSLKFASDVVSVPTNGVVAVSDKSLMFLSGSPATNVNTFTGMTAGSLYVVRASVATLLEVGTNILASTTNNRTVETNGAVLMLATDTNKAYIIAP